MLSNTGLHNHRDEMLVWDANIGKFQLKSIV